MKTPLIAALLLASASACSPSAGVQEVRKHTYPPDFRYIDDSKLDSVMWKLAAGAIGIDGVLRTASPAEQPGARAVLVRHIAEMESAASLLETGRRTNHPEIDRNITAFRRELELARRAAESEPPSFLLAAAISTACLHCHDGADSAESERATRP